MLNNINNIEYFAPQEKDVFVLDTNVLIKIFYPTLGAKNSAPYIKLYQAIKSSKANVLISSIQLSEFVNRCIRFQFDLYKETHPDIKKFKDDYRNTADYKKCMEAILEIVENDILSCFVRVNDNFKNMSTEHILMHNFSYDFNDALIAEVSRQQKAYLVTDDGDYANYLDELKLITNNRVLLMFQSQR